MSKIVDFPNAKDRKKISKRQKDNSVTLSKRTRIILMTVIFTIIITMINMMEQHFMITFILNGFWLSIFSLFIYKMATD